MQPQVGDGAKLASWGCSLTDEAVEHGVYKAGGLDRDAAAQEEDDSGGVDPKSLQEPHFERFQLKALCEI